MSVYAYSVRRLLQALLILFGVLCVLFLLFHVVGGDPALVYAGKNADAQSIELLRQQMGLQQPLVTQFSLFVKQALFLDWGTSWVSGRPVVNLVFEGLGPSVTVTLTGFVFSFLLALALAYVSVHYRGRWPEIVLNATVALLMSVSFIVLILFFQKLFAFTLNWFPVYGWGDGFEKWRFAALPSLIFMIATFSGKFLIFRELIAEEMNKRYVTTARSKGANARRIYFVHVFKNICPSFATLISAQVPALITGSLLLEMFFGIPGVGYLLLRSIQSSDFPTVKALTIFGSFIYIGCLFVGDMVVHWSLPSRERL